MITPGQSADVARSGTDTHATPHDVFKAVIDQLVLCGAPGEEQPVHCWAHFEAGCYQRTTELKLLEENVLVLKVWIPSGGDPAAYLASCGLGPPASWDLCQWEGEISRACYRLPPPAWPGLPIWLDRYYQTVFGYPPDYHVRGWIESID